MIFVEWISTKAHRSFNESLFAALGLKDTVLYSFSDLMRVPGQCNIVIACDGRRMARAWNVWKICWKHRRESIFLLTYDALLFPALQLFCPRLYVYEHNTTPEGALYRKHAAWQQLLFRRVTRFAQFPTQHEILQKLGQKSVFLGSPLPEKTQISRPNARLYIAPSDRIDASVLLQLEPFIADSEVIIRDIKLSQDDLAAIKRRINITPVSYIDMDQSLPLTKGIAIAIASNIRGSGWFNEGIRFGIPLIIIDKALQAVFEKTFPNYPYVALDRISTPADLDAELDEISGFDNGNYIAAHNARVKRTFMDVVGSPAVAADL